MAFDHGRKGRVLLAQYDVSSYLKEFTGGQALDVAEVSVLTNTSKAYVLGQGDGKVSLGGYFDGATAGIDAIMTALKGAVSAFAFTVAIAGYGTVGSRVLIGKGWLPAYEISGSVGDAQGITAEVQSDDELAGGNLLADLAARTATLTGTSVDNAASSANGGIAVIHMTAWGGPTSIAAKIQHSTNDSTWADLTSGGFTTLTAVGSEWIRVPAGTTVNRYVRVLCTQVGVGSWTAAVSFARL